MDTLYNEWKAAKEGTKKQKELFFIKTKNIHKVSCLCNAENVINNNMRKYFKKLGYEV